jgi:hypothetical protein
MNQKVKSTLIISGVGLVLITVGLFVYKTFILPNRNNNTGGGGGGNTGGDGTPAPPAPQPTISRGAAMGIADTLHSEMDGCNTYFAEAFKSACSSLQNNLDWQLVVEAFGSRYTDGCAPFTGHTGDLSSTMKWELDTDEIAECRSYLSSKGISSSI